MKIVVLGSSSSGNSTYVELGNNNFLIDVGLGFNAIKDKLFKLGVYPDEIDFILITHAHSDHVRSLHSFVRVYNTKVYIGKNTFNEYIKNDCLKNYEYLEDINNINGIDINIIPISHDKNGFGFIFKCEGKTISYLTDTGYINVKYHKLLTNNDVYLIESNHDVLMEMNGTKDQMTKERNVGDMGHLSNDQCAMYLSRLIGKNTKAIMLMHISEHDNTYDLAFNVNRNSISNEIPIYLSHKSEISQIIEL